jgi:predicted histidine transporter YuiF (NhaC family)
MIAVDDPNVMSSSISNQHFVPSSDVAVTIILPTIIFCIGMVIAMLIGINKCKQWELDKIVEMRRTRRVIQRITARLREKNFRTIQSELTTVNLIAFFFRSQAYTQTSRVDEKLQFLCASGLFEYKSISANWELSASSL